MERPAKKTKTENDSYDFSLVSGGPLAPDLPVQHKTLQGKKEKTFYLGREMREFIQSNDYKEESSQIHFKIYWNETRKVFQIENQNQGGTLLNRKVKLVNENSIATLNDGDEISPIFDADFTPKLYWTFHLVKEEEENSNKSDSKLEESAEREQSTGEEKKDNQTIYLNKRGNTPFQKLDDLLNKLDNVINDIIFSGNEENALMNPLKEAISQIRKSIHSEDSNSVIFLGSNRVGKSFLINLLLRISVLSQHEYKVSSELLINENTQAISYAFDRFIEKQLFEGAANSPSRTEKRKNLQEWKQSQIQKIHNHQNVIFPDEEWIRQNSNYFIEEEVSQKEILTDYCKGNTEKATELQFLLPNKNDGPLANPLIRIRFSRVYQLVVIFETVESYKKKLFVNPTKFEALDSKFKEKIIEQLILAQGSSVPRETIKKKLLANMPKTLDEVKIDEKVMELLSSSPDGNQFHLYSGNGKNELEDRTFIKTKLRSILAAKQIFLAIKELILFVPSALLEGGTEFHDIPGLKDFNPIHFPILSERLEMAKLIFTIIGNSLEEEEEILDLLNSRVLEKLFRSQTKLALVHILEQSNLQDISISSVSEERFAKKIEFIENQTKNAFLKNIALMYEKLPQQSDFPVEKVLALTSEVLPHNNFTCFPTLFSSLLFNYFHLNIISSESSENWKKALKLTKGEHLLHLISSVPNISLEDYFPFLKELLIDIEKSSQSPISVLRQSLKGPIPNVIFHTLKLDIYMTETSKQLTSGLRNWIKSWEKDLSDLYFPSQTQIEEYLHFISQKQGIQALLIENAYQIGNFILTKVLLRMEVDRPKFMDQMAKVFSKLEERILRRINYVFSELKLNDTIFDGFKWRFKILWISNLFSLSSKKIYQEIVKNLFLQFQFFLKSVIDILDFSNVNIQSLAKQIVNAKNNLIKSTFDSLLETVEQWAVMNTHAVWSYSNEKESPLFHLLKEYLKVLKEGRTSLNEEFSTIRQQFINFKMNISELINSNSSKLPLGKFVFEKLSFNCSVEDFPPLNKPSFSVPYYFKKVKQISELRATSLANTSISPSEESNPEGLFFKALAKQIKWSDQLTKQVLILSILQICDSNSYSKWHSFLTQDRNPTEYERDVLCQHFAYLTRESLLIYLSDSETPFLILPPSYLQIPKYSYAIVLFPDNKWFEVINKKRKYGDKNVEREKKDDISSDRLIGKIYSYNPRHRFGFIKHPQFPTNVFFHKLDLAFKEGMTVSFSLTRGKNGGPRAESIRIESQD